MVLCKPCSQSPTCSNENISDEEACRRLFTFLFGEGAQVVIEALLHATDEVSKDDRMTPEIKAAFERFMEKTRKRGAP